MQKEALVAAVEAAKADALTIAEATARANDERMAVLRAEQARLEARREALHHTVEAQHKRELEVQAKAAKLVKERDELLRKKHAARLDYVLHLDALEQQRTPCEIRVTR